jgi:hypothetical protein
LYRQSAATANQGEAGSLRPVSRPARRDGLASPVFFAA